MPSVESSRAREAAVTLVLALCGGLAGNALGLPAGWLLGSLALTFTAAMAGLRLYFPTWLQTAIVFLIGINIGGAMDPGMIPGLGQWLPSLLGLFASLALTLLLVALFLRHTGGFDRNTALLAAYPGHLVLVLQTSTEYRCDPRRVTMTQSLRVLALAACLPAIAHLLLSEPPEPVSVTTDYLALGLLAAAGLLGIAVARRIRLPAAILIGTVGGAGTASLAGISMGEAPSFMQNGILMLAGALIGSRFVRADRAALLRVLPVALTAVLATVLLTALLALPVSLLVDIPFGQLLLAYAPGGAEIMPVIAMATGYDPAFVGVHHVVRLVIMALALPLLARWLLARER